MIKQLPSVDHCELIRHVGSCFDSDKFKEMLTTALNNDAAVFFTSITHDTQTYAQPILMPVKIANELMTEVLKSEKLTDDQFSQYLTNTFHLMQMNAVLPAPMYLHFHLLEMFERIVHNGMTDKLEEVRRFTNIQTGSMAVIQVELTDPTTVITGIKIVPDALAIYEAIIGTVMLSSPTIH